MDERFASEWWWYPCFGNLEFSMGSEGWFKCMYVALSTTLVTDDYTCSMPTGVDPKLLMEQWRVYWTSVGSLQEQSLLDAGLPLHKDPTAAQLILLASGRLHIVASCWLEGQFDFWSYHSCCFDPWYWECFQITESIDSRPRFLCDFNEVWSLYYCLLNLWIWYFKLI